MIYEVTFPEYIKENSSYYKTHTQFMIDYAKKAGITVSYMIHNNRLWWLRGIFSMLINDTQCIIDYTDHTTIQKEYNPNIPYLKFHYDRELCKDRPNIYPLGPIIVHPDLSNDLSYFLELIEKDNYNPLESDVVQCKQRPYAGALERRTMVKQNLKERYGSNFDGELVDKKQFWDSQSHCLVAVCVPGARNDMLDRGQWEQMGLGVCTISPELNVTLPKFNTPLPGIHYIECKPDYSDLIDLIEWCKENRQICKDVGNRAKSLFISLYTPHKYWKWIDEIITSSIH